VSPHVPHKIVALALTDPEVEAVRDALRALARKEPEREAVRSVLQMLRRPLAPGELNEIGGKEAA
jgi:hypothetical protein